MEGWEKFGVQEREGTEEEEVGLERPVGGRTVDSPEENERLERPETKLLGECAQRERIHAYQENAPRTKEILSFYVCTRMLDAYD